MTETTSSAPVRRLLHNGEALRIDVTAPQGGGGPKFEPRTADEARSLLLPQVQSAVATAHAIPAELRAPDQIYLEARLLPNYLAASYFPSALFSEIGATPVGSRADTGIYRTATREQEQGTRRVVFTVSDDGLDELEGLVESTGRTRTQAQAFAEIRKIDEIALPAPEKVLRSPAREKAGAKAVLPVWETVLHPSGSVAGELRPANASTIDKWLALIAAEGGVAYTNYMRTLGGLTFMPVGIPADHVANLAKFNPLRVLRPMPAIRPRPHFGLRSVPRLSPPSDSNPISEIASVAVFDGGVDSSKPSKYFPIDLTDLTPEPAEQDELDHGTGVTGAVLYGIVTPGDSAWRPPLRVQSYRVLPAPPDPADLEGYWVLDQIKAAVQSDGHKIVNLSLGPTLAVEDDMEPNRWTSELDQLAWDNDVLFVIAAGNDGDADQDAGLHRVQVPADMANGLAVGSCDKPAPEKPWSRAPYSSMGPGRHGSRIQPIGVQFGGVDDRMFNVLRADGSFLEATGTSFSAPVTTHALSELATHLPRVNSSILRAFATHFAEQHSKSNMMRDEIGYGRQPHSYAEFLDCGADEVHVLFADTITRNDLMGYHLPIPRSSTSRLKVRMTLAYASAVDPTQPTEYTSASIESTLRPHQHMFSFRPPPEISSRSQTLDLRSDDAGELLAAGWTPSQEPVTKSLGVRKRSGEQELRDAGKWETVRYYQFALNESEYDSPRLELSYVARRAGALDRSPTEVPFALLISVQDASKSGSLYDQTALQFSALRPVQRVVSRVRTRGGSSPSWY